jgi:transcriptional regulator with XRE-family HTH domain
MRNDRGMTMVELARRARVSQALISQVENERSDPSLETLRRIAEVLDVPLFDLFSDAPKRRVSVLRATDRPSVTNPGTTLTYEKVSPSNGVLEVLRGRLRARKASSESPHHHPAHECIVVETGELVVEINGEEVTLAAGDSCMFDSSLPHRYRNRTDHDAVFLVFATPPSF